MAQGPIGSGGGAGFPASQQGAPFAATVPGIILFLLGTQLEENSFPGSKILDANITPAKLDRAYQETLSALQVFSDSFRSTDEATPTNVGVGDDTDPASRFANGVDEEIKLAFRVDDNKTATGGTTYHLNISPTTSLAATFTVEVEYRINGGALVGPSSVNITPSTTIGEITESPAVLTLGSGVISAGDRVLIKIKRKGTTDAHTGAMDLHSVIQKTTVS